MLRNTVFPPCPASPWQRQIGHAIYGLDHVKDVIQASTKTLLEEPRAELTALATMKLLVDEGRVSEEGELLRQMVAA